MYIEHRLTDLENRVAKLEALAGLRAAQSPAPPAVLPTSAPTSNDWKVRRRQQIDNARAAGWPNRVFSREDRIRVLVDHNPKRGTARIRFALYRTGMIVGEYLDAAAEASPHLAYRAMGDLSWDMGQGWIEVAPASERSG